MNPRSLFGGAGGVKLVRPLIAQGAGVNMATSDDETALQHARAQGYREIVALLERAGARR
jgi:hypothetical protein